MSRLDLQQTLEKIGCPVHYQPPSNYHLTYPCIIYELDAPDTLFANNKQYLVFTKYNITYITKNADDKVPLDIIKVVRCGAIKNFFKQDNLYHTVITCQELY